MTAAFSLADGINRGRPDEVFFPRQTVKYVNLSVRGGQESYGHTSR